MIMSSPELTHRTVVSLLFDCFAAWKKPAVLVAATCKMWTGRRSTARIRTSRHPRRLHKFQWTRVVSFACNVTVTVPTQESPLALIWIHEYTTSWYSSLSVRHTYWTCICLSRDKWLGTFWEGHLLLSTLLDCLFFFLKKGISKGSFGFMTERHLIFSPWVRVRCKQTNCMLQWQPDPRPVMNW